MARNRIKITFSCGTILQRVSVQAIVHKCITEALNAEKVPVPCEINVLVTDNTQIQTINRMTRQIDSATDVLSFPMFQFEAGILPEDWSEYMDPGTGMCPLGDMVLSLERAISQSEEFGHSTRREIGYLTIHSVLHLLGYDHLDEGPQKVQMRKREEEIASCINGMQRT